jgi:hypothetical protein
MPGRNARDVLVEKQAEFNALDRESGRRILGPGQMAQAQARKSELLREIAELKKKLDGVYNRRP